MTGTNRSIVMDSFNIARSGMQFGQAIVTAAAANVANARTLGTLPSNTPATAAATAAAVPAVYQPIRAVGRTQPGGGVAVRFEEEPGYRAEYDPENPFADADGMVAAPAVDLAEESIDRMIGVQLYTASAAALRTAGKMADATLDLLA